MAVLPSLLHSSRSTPFSTSARTRHRLPDSAALYKSIKLSMLYIKMGRHLFFIFIICFSTGGVGGGRVRVEALNLCVCGCALLYCQQ